MDADELRQAMTRYQAGSLEAFDRLYAALAPSLLGYIRSLTRDRARAEDLVQETFLHVHRSRHTFRRELAVRPWVFAVARHVWLMDQRTRSRRPVANAELPELRSAIERDLRPVVALAAPSRRVVWVIPFALLLLAAAVVVFGLRLDAPALGLSLTWVASSLQVALGLAVVTLALREAVPGTTLTRRAIGAASATAAIGVVSITWLTWGASATRVAAHATGFVWRVCFGATILTALPPLLVSGWLVARAFPLRPRLAGSLSGLGAGLVADAGWRLFCHFSDPVHVLGAHTAAIVVVSGIGALLAVTLGRRP